MNNICYSGGCDGADLTFGECALAAGHKVVHFAFGGMHSKAPQETIHVLNPVDLYQADEPLMQANKALHRRFPTYKSVYVDNLLRRNFWQIKDTERVYAVAPMNEYNMVKGGTAWAVQMAADRNVPEIYLFNLNDNLWYRRIADGPQNHVWGVQYFSNCWSVEDPPKPEGKYTGIGSREITEKGIEAIRSLYA